MWKWQKSRKQETLKEISPWKFFLEKSALSLDPSPIASSFLSPTLWLPRWELFCSTVTFWAAAQRPLAAWIKISFLPIKWRPVVFFPINKSWRAYISSTETLVQMHICFLRSISFQKSKWAYLYLNITHSFSALSNTDFMLWRAVNKLKGLSLPDLGNYILCSF